jgi:DNA-binding SARP family transcriptional activator/Tfp pilus assembly protein PilF
LYDIGSSATGPHVGLLGPLEIRRDGLVVNISGSRTCRLLAILLLNANNVVSADMLVEELWDVPPLSARQQIQNAVLKCRQSLMSVAELRILTTKVGYLIEIAPERLDVACFQRALRDAHADSSAGNFDEAVGNLQYALSLWRGQALAGLDGRYISGAAARLNEDRLTALETLMALRIQAGDSKLVVGELMEHVAANPLRESLRASLMLALYKVGRQADALAVYEHGRQWLADEYGLDPSPELRALHGRILRADRENSVDAETRGDGGAMDRTSDVGSAVELTLPKRSYLPRGIQDFVGRSDEVDTLVRIARQQQPASLVISTIGGMGGVGKTALAIRVGYLVLADHTDGQYFVDLRGFSIGVDPLVSTEALASLLRQCGVPEELIPLDHDSRSAMWRSELAGKRSLVLLDNAVDAAQVRPLLPGTSGTLVIITSRRMLPSLESSVSLSLDLLPLDDAASLFRRIVDDQRSGLDPEGIAAVVELCGRLPLAIRIAAARFRDRKTWSIRYLVDQLSSHRSRARFLAVEDRSVSAVLSLSCKYLSSPHRRLFRLLSLHPGPDFDTPLAAVLAQLSLDQAEEALEALFDDNLLLQNGPGRYHFHDLVRDCAYQLLTEHDDEAVQHAARERIFSYYFQCAATWCEPMARDPFRFGPDVMSAIVNVRTPKSTAQAVEWLRTESSNITEVARAAFSWSNVHAWRLVCALQPYLRITNYAGASQALFNRALAEARSLTDQRAIALCLTGLALISREQHKMAEARRYQLNAIEISRDLGDRTAELYQMASLGSIEVKDNHLLEAHQYFMTAREIAADVGDDEAFADITNNLGAVSKEAGRYSESLVHFSEALAFYRRSRRPQSEAVTEVNIGLLLSQERRHHEAAESFRRADQLGDSLGMTSVEANAKAGLCVTYRACGDFQQALQVGRASLAIAREHRLLEVECDALNALGETHIAMGDLEQADEIFRRCSFLAADRLLRLPEARAHEGFAHIALRRGDIAGAIESWTHSLTIYPDGVAEAEHARGHLGAIDHFPETCLRCDAGG